MSIPSASTDFFGTHVRTAVDAMGRRFQYNGPRIGAHNRTWIPACAWLMGIFMLTRIISTPSYPSSPQAGRARLQAWLRNSGPSTEQPLDFIEIGTSDFDTLIQDADRQGLIATRSVSVDAMKMYLDRLPELPGAQKLNFAVVGYGPHSDHLDVYYISPEDITAHGLPEWLRGCNSVGHAHKAAAEILAEKGLAHLLKHHHVPVISISELMDRIGGCRIRKLKIDVEGLDPQLVMGYVGYLWKHPHCYTDEITFEYSQLSSKTAQEAVVKALGQIGYAGEARSTPIGIDFVCAYDASRDARRWMTRTIAQALGGRIHLDFFDEQAMKAALEGDVYSGPTLQE